MAREIVRAERGQAESATKAAIDIWYEVRYALEIVLRYGGLTPDSHEQLQTRRFPRLSRVVFGPPIVNIEKMLALTRAGLIDFGAAIDPNIGFDEINGRFELQSQRIGGGVVWTDILVDVGIRT